MIKKFRRRDYTVSAVRWLGEENCEEVFAFLGLDHPDDELDHGSIHFDNPSGGIDTVFPGDWVVANNRGAGHYAYDDAWFRVAFDPEEEDTDLPQPLLLWDEAAGVTHQDGRVTIPLSKALNLAQTAPAGKLILPVAEAVRLRRVLNAALFDAYETVDDTHLTEAECTNCKGSGLDPRYNGEFVCPDCAPAETQDDSVVEPHCDGFPTTCPTKITVPPAPPHHRGGFRCGCYDGVEHTGGNAEDCTACQKRGFDMLIYPWICPGKDPDTVRCAGVAMRNPHRAHDWQADTGMKVVNCPGYTESAQ